MKAVCMIPARGGSERIPGKNIKDFLGKPIITYPIEAAKASRIFDDIVVYTDSKDIRDIAVLNGVDFEWRIDADDTETLTETVIKFLNEPPIQQIDYLCVLLPTAVFVGSARIRDIQHFKHKDGIITICKYGHPIQRALHIKDVFCNTQISFINKKYEFTRTQDLEPYYYDAGQMYFLNVKSFLKQKKIFMENIYPIIIDAIDIDNPEDWGKAEAYYKYKKGLI